MKNKISYFYHINKDIPIPMYYQIKQLILKAIKEGELKGGDMLPAELEICEACQVSRPTIRQALSELVAEGYLNRCKGKGTFVSLPKIEGRFLNVLQSFNDEMRQKGMEPSTKIMSLEPVDGRNEINQALGIPASDKLFYLERLRYADGEPIVYLETFLPYHLLPELEKTDLKKQSLYTVLENEYRIKVTRVTREIEAVNSSKRIAEYLEMTGGKAVCLIHTTAYTEQLLPVEYSIAYYRGDRSKFNVELCR